MAAAETVHYEAHGLVADEIHRVQEGTEPGDGSVSPAVVKEKEMSCPYIQTALARERQDTMLAEAQAVRLARRARSQRRNGGLPANRRSPFGRTPGRLSAVWGRLLGQRPGRRTATG